MDQYVLFVLALLAIILIFRRSSSTYLPGTPQADYTPQFVSISQDVTAASLTNPTYVLSQNAGDNLLGRLALNNFLWSNGGTGSVTINGTPVQLSTIWGVRKQLTIGGGGQVWYILNAPQLGGPTPSIIDTYVDSQVPPASWAIPQFVLIQKSKVYPFLQCDANSTATVSGCVCNAGYYGTGDILNTGGNPLGCNLCLEGYYCPGGTVCTLCPTNSNYSVSGSVASTACGLQCLATANGGTQTAGTTSSAAVCYCNPGLAFSTLQNASSSYYQNACIGCNAGYSLAGSSTSPSTCGACGSGYYQTNPNATSCPICTAGKSTQGVSSAAISCVDCLAGSVGPTDGTVNCTNCNSGSYVATAGQTQCQTCAGGNYSGPSGLQTQCTQCGAGTYSLTGASQCTNCGSGSWANPGSTVCTPWAGATQLVAYGGANGACTAGQYGLAGGGCGTCPGGQTSVAGSMGIAACYTPCATSGSKVVSSATTSSGAVCQCVAGYAGTGTTCNQCQLGYTYSSVDGAASCSAVTSCSTGYSVSIAATTIANNACYRWASPYTITGGAPQPAGTTTTLPNCVVSATMVGVWVWQVPVTKTYQFVVTGANSGAYNGNGGVGRGATVTATYNIPINTYVYMVVGQGAGNSAGGGSFVFVGTTTLITSTTSLSKTMPLIVAGGGSTYGANASLTASGNNGSGSYAGSGGSSGGDGGNGSGAGSNGGFGITTLITNGFAARTNLGGGAGGGAPGGGAGGYSGGGGGTSTNGGGGGGSFCGMTLVGSIATSSVTTDSASGSIVIS